MINKRYILSLVRLFVLCLLFVMTILYWKTYQVIKDSIVLDTFEREALKVDFVFNTLILVFVFTLTFYVTLLNSARKIKFFILFLSACLIFVFCLYAIRISNLVGGIL